MGCDPTRPTYSADALRNGSDASFQRLLAFRQAVYEQGFTKRRDSQFELLDALLCSSARSFPELSCLAVFRRRWPSVYAALEDGRQDTPWLQHYLIQQLPTTPGIQVFALDGTAWPRPAAVTLPDRQYVYSPTKAVNGGSVVVGSPYSLLTWVVEPQSSWALPLDVERIASDQDALTVGIAQVQRLCRHRQQQLHTCLPIVVADAKYGTHHFLRPLRTLSCGVLVRMRRDRVLYLPPGPYRGRGRPVQHGAPFRFKDPTNWETPDHCYSTNDLNWGQVEIRAWEHLHAREAGDVLLTVLHIQVHGEHASPPEALWLAWQGPAQPLDVLWHAYQMRWPVEPSIRTRKQQLAWILPQFRTNEACDRWTMLISLAQWMLFLARPLIPDCPLPWQPRQVTLTPKRVQQGWGVLFAQIGTPTAPPKPRGMPSGWPKGRERMRPPRHAVVKKAKKPPGKCPNIR